MIDIEDIKSIEKALTMPVQWPAKLFEISILALDGKLEEAKKLAGIFTNQHPNITIKDYESIRKSSFAQFNNKN